MAVPFSLCFSLLYFKGYLFLLFPQLLVLFYRTQLLCCVFLSSYLVSVRFFFVKICVTGPETRLAHFSVNWNVQENRNNNKKLNCYICATRFLFVSPLGVLAAINSLARLFVCFVCPGCFLYSLCWKSIYKFW